VRQQGAAILKIERTGSACGVGCVSSPGQFVPGTTQATFGVVVRDRGTAIISASFGGVSMGFTLTAAPRPVTLTSIALPALIILQDGAVTGTVNLSGGAAAN